MTSLQPTITDNGLFSNIQITGRHPDQITFPSELEVRKFYQEIRKDSKSLPLEILSINQRTRKFKARVYLPDQTFIQEYSMADCGISPYKSRPPRTRWTAINYLISIEKPAE